MLPVYICEDDEAVRAAQEEFLRKLILMEGYDMELVLCTGHPEDVLLAAERHPKRGVYFLDVELKGEQMDGFLLGKRLRALDPRGFLIYVTAFSDLAFETVRYHLEAGPCDGGGADEAGEGGGTGVFFRKGNGCGEAYPHRRNYVF